MLKKAENLLFFAAVVAALTLAALPALQEARISLLAEAEQVLAAVQLEGIVIRPAKISSPEQAATSL
jgi:hypothetical protein